MNCNKRLFHLFFYVVIFLLTLFISSNVLGAQQLSNNDANKIIEQGWNDAILNLIPIGKIVLGPEMSTKVNVKEHIFTNKSLGYLNSLQKSGLITLNETTNKLAMYAALGERIFNAGITDKGTNIAIRKNDQGDYLIRTKTMKIVKIIKNSEYTPASNLGDQGGLDRSAEYKVILGTYELKYENIGVELFSNELNFKKVESFKFKALLKYDPFNSKWIFVKGDWGLLNKDSWETNQIK